MAWSGGSVILLCLGLFLVAGSFCSCSPLTRLKALDTLKYKSTVSHGQAEGGGLHHGRLLIGPSSQQDVKGMRSSEEMNIDVDYQADMGWAERALVKGEASSSLTSDYEAVERLLKLEPKVECTGDSMRLRIQDGDSTPGSLFFVDRGGTQSPLPLAKLPQSCGYTVRSTRRDFVLAAPYDGCFVAHEENCYTLPLRWCGVPVRMSCPSMRPSAPNPPMVTCHAEGMVVKTEWKVSVANMKVHLSGKWEPLMMAAAKCRFSVVAHPEGVAIGVHYAPCLEKKDNLYTLELAGEGQTNVSCPALSTTQVGSTQYPPKNPEMPSKERPSSNGQPSDTSASGSEKPNPESGGHHVLVFPQNPEVPNQGTKETGPPQNPWYYLFSHAYPGNPVTTAQPLTFPLTKTTDLPPNSVPPSNPQVPQQFDPNVWRVDVPKGETPGKSPVAQNLYYFPYHYLNPHNFNPGQQQQLPPAPPAVKPTQDPKWQIYNPFPWTQQPPKSENPATQPPITQPLPPVTYPTQGPSLPGRVQEPQVVPGRVQEPQVVPGRVQEPQVVPGRVQEPQVVPGWVQEPQVPPKAPVSQGQMHQFYQYPFMHPWLQGPYPTQMPPMQQPATLAPKGKVNQPSSPSKPEPSEPKTPATPATPGKAPPQPQVPGQFYQYLYPHPAEKPIPHQQPSQPEAPAGQIPQQFQHYFFYQPHPGQQPVEKPQHETIPPQMPKEPGAGTPTERPASTKPPPVVNPSSKGQMFHYLNPYYPIQPPPATLPPMTTTQRTPTVHLGKGGNAPAGQQPGSPYRPSLYCPQVCPPDFSNCCPQIAFHQHLHHFIPPGSKNYVPALPFLQSGGFPGQGNGPADPPPEETNTAATTLPQSLSPGGINTMSVLGKPTEQEPTYPNILHYAPHNFRHSLSSVGNGEGNPIGPHYILHPGPQMSHPLAENMKNLPWPDFTTFLAPQQLAKSQMQPSAKVKPLVHVKTSNYRTHPPAEYIIDRVPGPRLMAHDARVTVTNSSQPFVSVIEKFPNNWQIQPGPKGYVLLPDGWSGFERNTYNKDLDPERFLQPPFQYLETPQDKLRESNSWPVYASANEPQSAPEEPLNPEFLRSLKKVWNPSVPLDSDSHFPSHVAEEELPGWH